VITPLRAFLTVFTGTTDTMYKIIMSNMQLLRKLFPRLMYGNNTE